MLVFVVFDLVVYVLWCDSCLPVVSASVII